MPANSLPTQETILNLIDELIEQDIPVIVEGYKDRQALKELGLKRIITLNKPLYKIVESLKSKEVAVLTDLDWRGKKLYSRISHDCQRFGIKVNNKLRHFLFRKTPLRHIEGLGTFLRHLEDHNHSLVAKR